MQRNYSLESCPPASSNSASAFQSSGQDSAPERSRRHHVGLAIDAHHHFWKLARGDYRWLTPNLAPLHRDFLPQHLKPLLRSAGVRKTVLVQAADSVAETRYLLSLAAEENFIAGVVGWVDMEDDAAPRILEELADTSHFVGVRPMIQDLADTHWMLNPRLQPVFVALQRLGLTFDALVKPVHLSHLLTLLRRHPDLPVVIDHAAKPDIANADNDHWQAQMRKVAAFENCYCKLSGLLTEAGANPQPAQIRPYVDFLLECFGARKLMWGSDWPVLNLAGCYQGWRRMCEDFTAQLSKAEQEQIFSGTAARFYGLGASGEPL